MRLAGLKHSSKPRRTAGGCKGRGMDEKLLMTLDSHARGMRAASESKGINLTARACLNIATELEAAHDRLAQLADLREQAAALIRAGASSDELWNLCVDHPAMRAKDGAA